MENTDEIFDFNNDDESGMEFVVVKPSDNSMRRDFRFTIRKRKPREGKWRKNPRTIILYEDQVKRLIGLLQDELNKKPYRY